MTFAAASWALTLTLPSSPKFVLLVLANYSDENESCYPGISRLSENTGYSERSIKSSLAVLEQEGLISRSRRYNHFGGRTSDRYLIHVGRTPLSKSSSRTETSAGEAAVDEQAASGADFAPDEPSKAVDNSDNALGAKFAPNDGRAVDNSPFGSSLGANDAPLGATGSPLKEEQLDRSFSSSSTQVTSVAFVSERETAAGPPEDDGELAVGVDGLSSLADGERPPLDLQGLLRAGIELSLREIDPRLKFSEIIRRLSDSGVDSERIDVSAAASFVLAAAARQVGDPSAYVAAAIVRDPARWPWQALPASRTNVDRSTRSICVLQGHRYLDEFRIQCVRCEEERPGWREERYAAEAARTAESRAAAS